MPRLKEPESEPPQSRRRLRERQQSARRVYLDAATPTIRSIVRVVLVTLLLLFVAGWLQAVIGALTYLFFIIVLSVFFAYLIDPIVRIIRRPFKDRGRERLMPRSLAIVLAYLFVFTVLGIAISNIAPRVVEQAKEFGSNLPAYGQSFRKSAEEFAHRYERLRIPDEVQVKINEKVTELGGGITTALGGFVLALVTYLPWFILIPVLAFFFLKDVNQFRLGVLRLFPAGRWRARAELVLADVNTTLAAYTRAQLISCILIAAVCTLGFYLLGLKYALLLGILAGIFEFVPLLGPLTIGIIVVSTAALSADPWKALYAAIFLIVLRITHDYVTYPRIVRGGIHLHPLAIILSVLAGEQVAGIPGVFLSIPIVAVATVIYRHVVEHRGSRGIMTDLIEEADAAPEEAA
ncbi:MAG: AI-2E family transporter [Chloracidobacterium sp.]|nr:AI-2E family transporter [Chloracidobacterium sp.]